MKKRLLSALFLILFPSVLFGSVTYTSLGGTNDNGVNVYTGEAAFTVPIFSISAGDIKFNGNAYYNSGLDSRATTSAIPMGVGWVFDIPKIVGSPGSGAYLIFNNTKINLYRSGSNTFIDDPFSFSKITYSTNSNSWTVVSTTGHIYTYSSLQKARKRRRNSVAIFVLSSISDTKGNSLQFSYSNGRLASIQNTEDQTLQFSYSGPSNTLSNIETYYSGTTVSGNNTQFGYTTLTSGPIVSTIQEYDSKGDWSTAGVRFNYFTSSSDPEYGLLESVVSPKRSVETYAYQSVKVGADQFFVVSSKNITQQQGSLNTQSQFNFEFTTSNAVVDASGKRVMFNQSKVSATSGSAVMSNGYREYLFYNSEPTANLIQYPYDSAYNGDQFPDELVGESYQINDYILLDSGTFTPSQQSTFYWNVYSKPARTKKVYASRVLKEVVSKRFPTSASDHTFQQNTQTHLYSYRADNGSLGTVTRNIVQETNGVTDTISQVTTYRYPLDIAEYRSQFLANNIISPIVQRITYTDGTLVHSNFIEWKRWGRSRSSYWAPSMVYQLEDLTKSPIVSSTGFDTDGWVTRNVIESRLSNGDITLQSYNRSIEDSTLYSDDGRFAVAQSVGADFNSNEAGYIGFESYESQSAFNIRNGTVKTSEAHTGKQSLGGTNLSIQPDDFNPNSSHYMVSAWVYLPEGNKAVIGFNSGKPKIRKRRLRKWSDYVMTTGSSTPKWVYIEAVTSQASSSTKPSLSITGGLVDDFRYGPVDAPFSASVYDATFGRQTEHLGMNGNTSFSIYDRFDSFMATLGPNETLSPLNQAYSTKSDAYTPKDLSSRLTVSSALPVKYTDFRFNRNTLWDLSHSEPANGYISDNQLVLNSIPFPHGGRTNLKEVPEHPYMVWLELDEIKAYAGGYFTFNINLVNGSTSEFSFKRYADGRWSTSSVPTFINRPNAKSIMIYVGYGQYMFFADGELLYKGSKSSISPGQTNIQIDLPSDYNIGKLSISKTAIIETPQLSMTYFTPNGQPKQIQTYLGHNRTQTQEYLLNESGLIDVITKPMIYDSLIGFQSDMVTALDRTQWTMQGDVSTYYNGTNGRSQDDERPFTRIVYDDSPLNRVIGRVLPGPASTDAENTVTRYSGDVNQLVGYHSNGLGEDFTATYNIFTNQLNAIGTGNRVTYYDYSDTTLLQDVYLPLYDEQSAAEQKISLTYDEHNNIASRHTPDTGKIQFVLDDWNKLRFKQTASQASNSEFTYYKYDDLKRVVESGVVDGISWDRDQLNVYANDASWPYPSVSKVWHQKWSYDGDGAAPNRGLLTQVETNQDSGSDAEVIEQYSYDINGRISTQNITVPLFSSAAYRMNYAYDNTGRISEMTYGDSSVVTYSYTIRGRIHRIYADGEQIASFSYNAANQLEAASYNNPYLQESYTYDSLGNLKTVSTHFTTTTLSYLDPSSGSYKDGFVNSVSVAYSGGSWPGGMQPLPYEYAMTYDDYNQLHTLEHTIYQPGIVRLLHNYAFSYDANGNVSTFSDSNGGIPLTTFNYYPDTNTLKNTSISNQVVASMSYTEDGAVGALQDGDQHLTFSYDAVRQLVTKITENTDEAVTTYFHGSRNTNVYESLATQNGTTKTLRMWDTHGRLLRDVNSDVERQYIYGPQGLLAFYTIIDGHKQFYYVLKDYLGNVSLVVDPNEGVVASYQYSPYGDIVSSTGDTSLLPLRFAGQIYNERYGLHDFKARLYFQEYKRFLSPDPLLLSPSPYEYGNNNPMWFVDKTGQQSQVAMGLEGYRPFGPDPNGPKPYSVERDWAITIAHDTLADIDEYDLNPGPIQMPGGYGAGAGGGMTLRSESERTQTDRLTVSVFDSSPSYTMKSINFGRGDDGSGSGDGPPRDLEKEHYVYFMTEIELLIEWIKSLAGESSYSTFAAVLVETADGTREVWIATAGAKVTDSYFPTKLRDGMAERGYYLVINIDPAGVSADRTRGIRSNHLNDAEMQLLREANESGATIFAVGATRPMCEVCQYWYHHFGYGDIPNTGKK